MHKPDSHKHYATITYKVGNLVLSHQSVVAPLVEANVALKQSWKQKPYPADKTHPLVPQNDLQSWCLMWGGGILNRFCANLNGGKIGCVSYGATCTQANTVIYIC